VVKDLTALPDEDIRAMAVYLASFNDASTDKAATAASLESSTATTQVAPSSVGAKLYQGACAVCHEVGGLQLFGSRPSLALNSNVHSHVPDNLIQIILHGVAEPASSDLGYMPAFKDALDDDQIVELVSYLRKQFAPDKPAWSDVRATLARIRAGSH
jgi:nicotinate dehydrogenase subunit B